MVEPEQPVDLFTVPSELAHQVRSGHALAAKDHVKGRFQEHQLRHLDKTTASGGLHQRFGNFLTVRNTASDGFLDGVAPVLAGFLLARPIGDHLRECGCRDQPRTVVRSQRQFVPHEFSPLTGYATSAPAAAS